MAFQGADISVLRNVASACQKGAAAAEAVIKILKKVIATLRASASGPWVEPFIRSLEALIKMLQVVVQRLTEFAKLLSTNAAEQEEVSKSESTVSGSTGSSTKPVTTSTESLKSVTDAVNSVNELLNQLTVPTTTETTTPTTTTPITTETATQTVAESPVPASTPAAAEQATRTPQAAQPLPAAQAETPAEQPVAEKNPGSPQVHTSPILDNGKASLASNAKPGALGPGVPIQLDQPASGPGMWPVGVGAGAGLAAAYGASKFFKGQTEENTNENQ